MHSSSIVVLMCVNPIAMTKILNSKIIKSIMVLGFSFFHGEYGTLLSCTETRDITIHFIPIFQAMSSDFLGKKREELRNQPDFPSRNKSPALVTSLGLK